jgi:cytochrome c peroxidase
MKQLVRRSILLALAALAIGAGFGARVLLAGSAPDPVVTTKEELGRLLFWDPILSGERNVACATCHHPDLAYADGRDLSLGAGAVGLGAARRDISGGTIPPVRRNSPTILNTVFNGLDGGRGGRRNRGRGLESVNQVSAPMFWDSRVRSLEAQALEPLKAFDEMRGNAYPVEVALDSVVARLRAIPEYVSLFAAV